MNFYRFILDEIDANRTFSLIRFGDGELQCIINTSTGYGGGNADGDPYLPKLGEYLKKNDTKSYSC